MFEIVDYEKARLKEYGISKSEYDKIVLPKRSTKYSCGYDFACPIKVDIVDPDKTYVIPTGIKVSFEELPSFPNVVYFLALYPRSSYGFNYNFKLVNTVGIIDQDYYNNKDNDGHILIGVKSEQPLTIFPGERFCQGIIQIAPIFDDVVKAIRQGGVGSTGVK